jgi:hypothetical protein
MGPETKWVSRGLGSERGKAENVTAPDRTTTHYTRHLLPIPEILSAMLSLLLSPGTSPEAFTNSIMENIPEAIFLVISINLAMNVGGHLSNFIMGHFRYFDKDNPQHLVAGNDPSQRRQTPGRDNEPTWKTRVILTLMFFTLSWRQPEPNTPYLHCLQMCRPNVQGVQSPSPPPPTDSNIPQASSTGHYQPSYPERVFYV